MFDFSPFPALVRLIRAAALLHGDGAFDRRWGLGKRIASLLVRWRGGRKNETWRAWTKNEGNCQSLFPTV